MSMEAVDLSLDEIIRRNKKMNPKLHGSKNIAEKGPKKEFAHKGQAKNRGLTKAIDKKRASSVGTGLAKKPVPAVATGLTGRGGSKQMIDARLKIIEMRRSKIRVSRERLNATLEEIDARETIPRQREAGGRVSKMRSGQPGPPRTSRGDPLILPPGGTLMRDPLRTLKRGGSKTSFKNMTPPSREWSDRIRLLPRLEVHLSPKYPRPTGHIQEEYQRGSSRTSTYQPKRNVRARLGPVIREDGHKIIVSNLKPTVNLEDIKELFGDIGELVSLPVVRPGVAEVLYKNMNDALLAIDTYHNRELDDQPMKCLLVKQSNAIQTEGNKGFVVPDMGTVHKALFSKRRH